MGVLRKETTKLLKLTDQDILLPAAAECYQKNERLAMHCEVSVSADNCSLVYVTYVSSIERRRRTVRLDDLYCSCLQWQQHEIPCMHAIAAAKELGRTDDMTVWYTHSISSIYFVKAFEAAIKDVQIVLPSIDELAKDDTKPAAWVVQAGRPRKKRVRSRGEGCGSGRPRKRIRCKRCGQYNDDNHNKVTCSEAPAVP